MSRPCFSAMRRLATSRISPSFTPCKALVAGGLALLLAACGGGGGTGTFGAIDIDGQPIAPETLYKIGNGAGSGFQEGAIFAIHTILRSGDTTQLRVNIVDGDGSQLQSSVNILFTSPCTATGLSSMTAPAASTPGLYSVTYTNHNCAGTDTVTARLPNNKTATVTLEVSAEQALSVTHVETTNDQLVLAGLGGQETSEVVFRVTGVQSTPIVGKLVTFTISSTQSQASIMPGWQSGLTDQDGNVRTIVRSGVAPGPFAVIATHTETAIQGRSPDITSSTRIAAANRLSLSYGPWNPAGAFNSDGVQVTINAIVNDMYGHSPLDGTRISFVSPISGQVNNSCSLMDGQCSVIWVSSGPRPANGRAQVLAYMEGAEAFVDVNGNSVYDAGDVLNGIPQFTDLGEPYLDINQNGMYDIGEFFFDVDNDGSRGPGDGVWNGPCLSAYRPVAVCSPDTSVSIFDEVTIVLSTNTPQILSLGNFPAIGGAIFITQGFSRTLSNMIVGDSNGNPLPSGTTVAFSIEGSGVSIQGLASTTIGNTINANSDIFGLMLVAAPIEIPDPIVLPVSCTDGDPLTVPNPGNPGCQQPQADIPQNVRLVLTVSIPGATARVYTWPIAIEL